MFVTGVCANNKKKKEPQLGQADGPELSKAWAEVCQESYEMSYYIIVSNVGTQSWVTCISPAAHDADSQIQALKHLTLSYILIYFHTLTYRSMHISRAVQMDVPAEF